jgi:rhodanese-related sulfurtransferase
MIHPSIRAAMLATALALCMPAGAAQTEAEAPLTPTAIAGAEVITLQQAQALMGKAPFFDNRTAISYGKGHVKGAKPLPYDQKSDFTDKFDGSKDKFDLKKLPADKSAVIVFYSDGPDGWKSYKAARTAVAAGYKNVKWMREGVDGWKAKGLPME